MTQNDLTDLTPETVHRHTPATEYTRPEGSAARASAAELAELILSYQHVYHEWRTSSDSQAHIQYRVRQHDYLEQLWYEICPDLQLMVRKWLRSEIAPDIESLAMNAFVPLVFALPKITPDPSRNVRGLLLTIARRGLSDQYNNGYAQAPDAERTARATDEPDTRMWPTNSSRAIAPEATIDPASIDAEERWLERIDRQTYLHEVWRYWQTALKEIDYRIVLLRWQSDPVASFRDIAQQLGAGWSEAAVRQRHFRILLETRKFLQLHGHVAEFDTG